MSDHLIKQYPAWREAIKAFMQERFAPGDTIPFDWLYDHFMVKRPGPSTLLGDAQKAELQFLSQFKAFEEALLTEHQIALTNVRGVGHRVVPAAEQTAWAESQGISEVKKAVRKLSDRLTNVDLVQLTASQRKDNADALARVAMMTGMLKSSLEHQTLVKRITEE